MTVSPHARDAKILSDERPLPSRWSNAMFHVKAALLRCRRFVTDVRDGIRRFAVAPAADYPVLLARSSTPLWGAVAAHDLGLQRGKVQNLRVAVRQMHGVAIPAGAVWSFWKHLGRASARRGFAEGRMLREGCVIPTIGGGLCQLSNALYEVALKSDCEVVERHRHSRILPGSAAAAGRDATVVWNYIDLRFRPRQDIRIDVALTAHELVVCVFGRAPALPRGGDNSEDIPTISSASECSICQETRCFRHDPAAPHDAESIHAFLLDEATPEFVEFVASARQPGDVLCRPRNGSRYAWPVDGFAAVRQAPVEAVRRAFWVRWYAHHGARRLQVELDASRRLALRFARFMCADVTHLTVSQSLLPFLWEAGALGGRTFDVLMTRLPFAELHAVLDAALSANPARVTLGEFRAPAPIVEAETAALRSAQRIVTPHPRCARLFDASRVQVLPWHAPPSKSDTPARAAIGFAGPTAARKGAFELREALKQIDVPLWVAGAQIEGPAFWRGHDVKFGTLDDVLACRVVVAPSLIEDAPRVLLAALARGRQVIATPACGLPPQPGLSLVPFGDVDALTEAMRLMTG